MGKPGNIEVARIGFGIIVFSLIITSIGFSWKRTGSLTASIHSFTIAKVWSDLDSATSYASSCNSTNRSLVGSQPSAAHSIIEPVGSWKRDSRNHSFYSFGDNSAEPGLNFTSGKYLLNGKWVYFLGDSTTRQLFSAFIRGVSRTSVSFQDMKAQFRASNPQRGRKQYIPLKSDNVHCYINEHVKDYVFAQEGVSINFTYGWKHFIHEEYDSFFIEEELAMLYQERGRVPDVIVLSTGLHNCYHFERGLDWENKRDLDALLLKYDSAPTPFPPVVWVDNVVPAISGDVINCTRTFNTYFRSAIKKRIERGGKKDALVSRENITWTAPEEYWDNSRRLHLKKDVYNVVGNLVLQAIIGLLT